MKDPDIVIAGLAGAAGARLIAAEKAAELSGRFRKDYLQQAAACPDECGTPEDFAACGAAFSFRSGEGGVLAGLYRLARDRKIGMEIEMKRIPVLQSTIEICEYYGLNPYRLYGRCFILLSENGERTAQLLRDRGIRAAVIGKTADGPKKIITDKTETEYLNRPTEDEIRKVLPQAETESQDVRRKTE